MSLTRRFVSFRARFLLIVVAAAVLPILVLGLWLTRDVARAGEQLVRARVRSAVDAAAARVGQRWMLQRSHLLDVADKVPGNEWMGGVRPSTFDAELAATGAYPVRVLDAGGRTVFATGDGGGTPVAYVPMSLPVHAGPLSDRIGTLEAMVPAAALLSETAPTPGGIGTLLGLYDASSLSPLVPLPFDVGDAPPAEIDWGGERWITVVRRLDDPPLVLVGAAPVSPLAEPFELAAREGSLLLAAAGLLAVVVAALSTTRLTRGLGRLAAAADAVAAGDLDLRVEDRGEDEVSRVGRAFNRMTASLRRTLQELADHRALAAVGEFAASLAHEIRNPLSAVRLDLQVVEEELPPDSPLRRLQRRALAEIERMDATLGGALQTARSGRYRPSVVGLDEPLDAAIDSARAGAGAGGPEIRRRRAGERVQVLADADSLRQLFLNLLINAREAAGAGGRVEVAVRRQGGMAVVEIADDGPGVPKEVRGRAFEPLVSGRAGGTGLGLTVAGRIARAHDGEIELKDADGGGTVAVVRLPAIAPAAAPSAM